MIGSTRCRSRKAQPLRALSIARKSRRREAIRKSSRPVCQLNRRRHYGSSSIRCLDDHLMRFEPGQMIYFGLRIRVGATVKCVVGSLLALGVVWAQDAPRPQAPAPAPPQTKAQKDAQHRLGLVATRAVANFHSADSIEANLNRHGHTLNPQIVALRVRMRPSGPVSPRIA